MLSDTIYQIVTKLKKDLVRYITEPYVDVYDKQVINKLYRIVAHLTKIGKELDNPPNNSKNAGSEKANNSNSSESGQTKLTITIDHSLSKLNEIRQVYSHINIENMPENGKLFIIGSWIEKIVHEKLSELENE